MKKVLLSLVALVCTVSVWAVPAYRGWQTKTQTDGSTIEVRQVGDEFYHYWENKEGKRVSLNADGTFVVSDEAVPSSAAFKAKRQASKLYSSRPRKAIGERNFAPKGLVILVQFQDVSFKAANNATAFDNMLNQEGYSTGGATGSAVDYFKAQSNGAYVPSFDVFGPVTLPNNLAYYGEQDYGEDGVYDTEDDGENDLYIADFVIDAVTAANDAGCDFSQYDSDGDGYVDIVYFFYAGKGQAAGGTPETIWPHNWELISALYFGQTHGTSGYYVNANSQGYITSMNLPTFDGKKINNYVCSAELKYSGSLSGIGTLCHEFSHVLGLPDYYDTNYGANNTNGVTPGKWSIMDQGSYNNDEMTPPNYSIYDKYFMGWATPKFLAKNAQLDVTLTTGYDDAYQITGGTSLVPYTNTGTVYYIENRQQSGWDAGLPGSGMIVWQVKYDASAWTSNAPNNEAGEPRFTIVPADGKTSNYGKASDAFPRTSVTSYKPYTGCELTQITKSGNNITFKYNGGAVNYWTYSLSGEHCTVPSDGQVDKNAALNLTITPDAGYTLSDADCWAVYMGDDELTLGSGFSYEESTGAFAIASVTGNVEILAVAKEIPQTITWMAQGEEFTTTETSNGLVLPATEPEACEGKVFYGWTASQNYTSETTAPTIVKTGDEATATTYYAVFATEEEGGGEPTIEKATSIAVGDEVILVYESDKMELTSFSTTSTVYGIGSEYTTTPSGVYSFVVVEGSATGSFAFERDGKYWNWSTGNSLSTSTTISANSSWNVSFSSGDAVIANVNTASRKIRWNSSSPRFACYTSGQNAVQLYKISGGGTSYSDFTTSCTPAEKYAITVNEAENGSLETNPADEAAAGKTVTITATPAEHYHLATLSVKDAEETAIEVSGEGNTRTFTMPAKAVTISATFAEDDQFTVRFFNNGTELSSAQYYAGESAVTPADPTPACEEYTFVGWWTAELAADNTTAQTWVSDFTVSKAQDYYAIYSKSEEGEGESEVAYVTFKTTTTDNNNDRTTSANIRSYLVETESGISSYAGSKLYANVSGLKMGSSSNAGYITLTLSSTQSVTKVIVNAAQYGSDTGDIKVEAGSTSLGTQSPASGLEFEAEPAVETNKITVSTTSKRAYVTAISIFAGGGSTTYYSSVVTCGTTAVEETNANANAMKVLKNGQIFILREGKTYTLTGNLVK
ncbi:MAG: M6 family metalloprotease domain-containing protein [Paludibacteraceae bacterium]|nr:M6 family metalloprotease domain-containing protein [Paludibacteraceae bacterium]